MAGGLALTSGRRRYHHFGSQIKRSHHSCTWSCAKLCNCWMMLARLGTSQSFRDHFGSSQPTSNTLAHPRTEYFFLNLVRPPRIDLRHGFRNGFDKEKSTWFSRMDWRWVLRSGGPSTSENASPKGSSLVFFDMWKSRAFELIRCQAYRNPSAFTYQGFRMSTFFIYFFAIAMAPLCLRRALRQRFRETVAFARYSGFVNARLLSTFQLARFVSRRSSLSCHPLRPTHTSSHSSSASMVSLRLVSLEISTFCAIERSNKKIL